MPFCLCSNHRRRMHPFCVGAVAVCFLTVFTVQEGRPHAVPYDRDRVPPEHSLDRVRRTVQVRPVVRRRFLHELHEVID